MLSNVVLDELDQELERRGHQFVRYADDCNIYVRTKRAGERVMSGVRRFIEKRLKLRVNESKSAVAPVGERKFLGFSFTPSARVRVSDQAMVRMKRRVRELTRPSGRSLREQTAELSRYLQGWIGYYGRSEQGHVISQLDGWIRRRVRVLHLKKWRVPRTRYSEFRRLGASPRNCRFLIHTTKRYWYLSGIQAVNHALSLQYFRDLELYFMYDRYELKSD